VQLALPDKALQMSVTIAVKRWVDSVNEVFR
jgi:hypothetical protein